MKTFVKIFLCLTVILSYCNTANAALHTFTSAGSNIKWSDPNNWDTAPVDGDAFALSAGQTCEFDVDLSAWTGLAASTIQAGTTLQASDTAGTYVLKMNGDLTVNGTLKAGTSLTVTYDPNYTINFAGGSNSIAGGTTGVIDLYCKVPDNLYVRTTGVEAIGQTELSIDTDLTGDIWKAGDTIVIVDKAVTSDIETRIIDSITSNTITVTVALSAQKETGACITLQTRNIKLSNGTDYAVKTAKNSHIGCEVTTKQGFTGDSSGTTFTGLSFSLTDNYCFGYVEGSNITANNCSFTAPAASKTGITGSYGIIFNDCIFSGFVKADSASGYLTYNDCYFIGNIYVSDSQSIVHNNSTASGISSFITGTSCNIRDLEIDTYNYLVNSSAYTNARNIFINVTSSTPAIQYYIYRSYGNFFYDCDFNAGNEFFDYTKSYLAKYLVTESFNHGQVDNAYKNYTPGGIVTSQTTSPPTGYTTWYEHACESADYPCFRQWEVTVEPNEILVVLGVMRIPDATDMSANPPKFEIIDSFADNLVDSTQVALASMNIPVSDGTNTGWQDMALSWTNNRLSPTKVLIRTTAQHASQQVDEAVSVPDMATQVSTIYVDLSEGGRIDRKINRILTGTDVNLPTLIGDVNDNLETAIGNITVDNGAIADEVVLHMDANSAIPSQITAMKSAMDVNFAAIDFTVDVNGISVPTVTEIREEMDSNSTIFQAIIRMLKRLAPTSE